LCADNCLQAYLTSQEDCYYYVSTALFVGPWLFFSFLILYTVRLLGRGISPSRGRYPHTEQHKHRIGAHTLSNALSGIRTHDPYVRPSEDSSCLKLRPRTLRTELCEASHIVNRRRYFSVRIANIAYVALCVAFRPRGHCDWLSRRLHHKNSVRCLFVFASFFIFINYLSKQN
jgi:hypothetical protein